MIQIDLNANMREQFGKSAMRKLRQAGRTPAVLYGPKIGTVALDLETKIFHKSLLDLQRKNAVISLTIEAKGKGKKSETHLAMVKELQTDPVLDSLIHADFIEIVLGEPISLKVPLQLQGICQGVEMGGEINLALPAVTLKGLVLDIPDLIEVDITSLDIGDSISCKDLNIPENVTMLDSEEQVCIAVGMPSRAEEEEVAEAAETAEGAEAEGGEAAAPAEKGASEAKDDKEAKEEASGK